jgi:hypothetical protein
MERQIKGICKQFFSISAASKFTLDLEYLQVRRRGGRPIPDSRDDPMLPSRIVCAGPRFRWEANR